MKASVSVVSHHAANIVQQLTTTNDNGKITGIWIKTNVASIFLDVDTIKECYKQVTK